MNTVRRFAGYLIPAIFFALISCTHHPDTSAVIQKIPVDLRENDVETLLDGYQKGTYTVRDVVQSYLDRIEKYDKNGPSINSIIEINPDALLIADSLDRELKKGKLRGPLHGVPVVLKDNIDTHDGMSTTAGSRALLGSHPLKDSWVAGQLKKSGAVIIAKANLSEWANFRATYSSSGWSGVSGQTKNPYDTARNPCGSSSGTGAAVSANFCVLGIGTETNGSIVCPSNNNGIVGIKPTVGLISRSGIVPISFTQDTPGPMTRTVKDAAICLGVLTGIDSSDTKTLASEGNFHKDYTQFLHTDGLRGKRLGLYTKPFGKNPRVDQLMKEAVQYMDSQGATVVEIDQISNEDIEDLSLQILFYEFKDGLNKYFASLGADAPVKNLEDLIAFNRKDPVELRYFDQAIVEAAQKKGDLNSEEYRQTLKKMLTASRENGLDKVLDEHQLDAIIAPTGGPAWKTDWLNGDNYIVYSSSPAAIAGYPNITVPMGNIEGLPVNISFFGRAWSEPVLLEIAYAYEQGTKKRIVPEF